jgi:hypothetical protein
MPLVERPGRRSVGLDNRRSLPFSNPLYVKMKKMEVIAEMNYQYWIFQG